MEKLLITGINGFVGSELASYFKDSYEVWGLDVENVSSRENFISSDITSIEKLSKDLKACSFDYIIHCAAIAHNDNNQFSFDDFNNVNAKGTNNLLRAIEMDPPKKFILFSTVAVYGEYGYQESVDESFPKNPVTDYAKSKVKAEAYCLENQKISAIVLRFPAIYSENLLKDFSKRILKKGKVAFLFGKGNQQHTFCHVETVKKQLAFILDTNNLTNSVLQMGDGFTYSSNEILKFFKPQLKLVIPIPKRLFKMFLKILSILFARKINSFNSIYWKLFENNVYSIDTLLKIGYKPLTNKLI